MIKLKSFRKLLIEVGAVLVLLGVIGAVYFNWNKLFPNIKLQQKNHMNIAVVNQDNGGTFNNINYQFGKDFTNLLTKINSDNTTWTVMSRSQAENRYNNNSVDAVIYISSDFSTNILQLDSFNPENAKISYKVKRTTDKAQSLEMEKRIGTYINVINQRAIKMYFASVINNLDDAKVQLTNIVGDEDAVYSGLSTNIYAPSQQSTQYLSNLTRSADGLKTSNGSFENSVSSFKDSTVKLLQNNASTLNEQLSVIQSNTELQSQINNHNASVSEKAVTNQYDTDSQLYSNLYLSTVESLNSFYNPSTDALAPIEVAPEEGLPNTLNDVVATEESKTVYQLFSEEIQAYNADISTYQVRIENARKKLDELRTSLDKTRSQISEHYFNTPEISVDGIDDMGEDNAAITSAVSNKVTQESAKQALAKQVSNSMSRSDNLPNDYTDQINSTIASLSVNASDYQDLFAHLLSLDAISSSQVAEYNKKIELLKNYADNKGATTGSAPNYNFSKVSNDTLPSSRTETVTFSNVYPESELIKETTDEEEKISTSYKETAVTVTVDSSSTVSATASVDKNNISSPTDLTLSYTFSPKYGMNTIKLNLTVGSETIPLVYSFYYSDSEEKVNLVENDLKTILGQLSRIDTAATTIKNLYGDPSSNSYDIDVANPADDSVFNLYGNIDSDSIFNQLKDSDVTSYKASGVELYTQLSIEINQLNAAIDELPSVDEATLPTNYFSKNLQDLVDWYNATVNSLNTQYADWQNNQVTKLGTASTNSGDMDDNTLYSGADSNNRLYETVSNLANATNTNASRISTNADSIGTMSTQFDSLVNQANQVQGKVTEVSDNTSKLVEEQADNIQNAKDYSENFNEVLNNARTGGTDNESVLNFLASPVQAVKIGSDSVLSTLPLWVWLLSVALLSSGLSIWGTRFVSKVKNSKQKVLQDEDEE
ncbi:type VII secretion protein EsaA [Streptococcus sp. H49]|uniref:type VII secretion protein EsaA n=1 Tax=Streptococcus huangxiaojuni TaxID=3237239 RepID=UPI0034A5C9C5